MDFQVCSYRKWTLNNRENSTFSPSGHFCTEKLCIEILSSLFTYGTLEPPGTFQLICSYCKALLKLSTIFFKWQMWVMTKNCYSSNISKNHIFNFDFSGKTKKTLSTRIIPWRFKPLAQNRCPNMHRIGSKLPNRHWCYCQRRSMLSNFISRQQCIWLDQKILIKNYQNFRSGFSKYFPVKKSLLHVISGADYLLL